MEEAFEIIATNFGWTTFLEGCFYKLRLEIFLQSNLKPSPSDRLCGMESGRVEPPELCSTESNGISIAELQSL